jgi:hypothetical protein
LSAPFGWVLANPKPLPFMPMRGRLKLFDPSEEVRQRVDEWGSAAALRSQDVNVVATTVASYG